MRILIIGKNSFIGNNFIKYSEHKEITTISARNIDPDEINYSKYDVILHLAAIVHQKKKIPYNKYREINTILPNRIASLAKQSGVKHFIFMSTISVYGHKNNNNITLNEFSPCTPSNGYGQSKLDAETQLLKLTAQNFLVTILRIPLVYGECVKANMLSIIKLVDKFPILPFAKTKNQRSFISTENLVEYIDNIIIKETGGVFLACDRESISTNQLVTLIAKYLEKKIYLFQLPSILILIGTVLAPNIFEKLYGSYTIKNNFSIKALNIKNRISIEDGIKKMVKEYKINKSKKN